MPKYIFESNRKNDEIKWRGKWSNVYMHKNNGLTQISHSHTQTYTHIHKDEDTLIPHIYGKTPQRAIYKYIKYDSKDFALLLRS